MQKQYREGMLNYDLDQEGNKKDSINKHKSEFMVNGRSSELQLPLSEYQSSPDNHPNMSEVVAELEDLTVEEQLLFTNTIHVKPYMDPDKQD